MNGYDDDLIAGEVKQVLQKLFPQEDFRDAELQETPLRFARMLVELTTHEPFKFTTFESDADEMVVIRDISFVSLCAHHIVPFVGVAHIGYVPNGKVGGLSKFARVVRQMAKGLWNQENLTTAIAVNLEEHLHPLGVAVVLSAEHLCMTIRGVQAPGTTTTTSKMTGCFADHSKMARSEFLGLIR